MALTKTKMVVIGLLLLMVAGFLAVLVFRYEHQYKGPSHFPKSAWVSAGSADPVSALETACWATMHGDGKTMLASLAPGLRQALEKAWEKNAKPQGMSLEDYFASLAKKPAGSVLGFRVLGEQIVNPNQVTLHVYVQGWWQKLTFKMKKIDGDWRVAGVQGDSHGSGELRQTLAVDCASRGAIDT